jgi:hypothetical protein
MSVLVPVALAVGAWIVAAVLFALLLGRLFRLNATGEREQTAPGGGPGGTAVMTPADASSGRVIESP